MDRSRSDEQDFLYDTVLDATNEFQATIFNALNGYYRQAIGCLRNALEQVTIGTYCQVCAKDNDFTRWRAGQIELSFRKACDGLAGALPIQTLNAHIQATLNDSLFNPKTKTNPGGSARRLYSELSNFSHNRPGFTNVDMWASNGPIYMPEAFTSTVNMYVQVSALSFLLVKLGRPTFALPPDALQTFDSPSMTPIKIARIVYEYLFVSNDGS